MPAIVRQVARTTDVPLRFRGLVLFLDISQHSAEFVFAVKSCVLQSGKQLADATASNKICPCASASDEISPLGFGRYRLDFDAYAAQMNGTGAT